MRVVYDSDVRVFPLVLSVVANLRLTSGHFVIFFETDPQVQFISPVYHSPSAFRPVCFDAVMLPKCVAKYKQNTAPLVSLRPCLKASSRLR